MRRRLLAWGLVAAVLAGLAAATTTVLKPDHDLFAGLSSRSLGSRALAPLTAGVTLARGDDDGLAFMLDTADDGGVIAAALGSDEVVPMIADLLDDPEAWPDGRDPTFALDFSVATANDFLGLDAETGGIDGGGGDTGPTGGAPTLRPLSLPFAASRGSGFGGSGGSGSDGTSFSRSAGGGGTSSGGGGLPGGGGTLSGPVAPTPEPATWAMMIVGFGLVGAALRRRAGAAGRMAPAR